ncbi:MAG: EcsC family protein [Propionibacteriaceae bacterium]|jgi:hypothetical protein|nr:EcsC family protein [Propionibacteriaceae bacterium]
MPKIGPVPENVVDAVTESLMRLPQIAGPRLNSAMVKLIDMAIDGVATLTPARELAAKHLQRHQGVNEAVDSIIRQHILLATIQGVISNIGGIVSMIIGTPINVTGLIVVQVRMVACIAHLHGYDLNDPRVRTALAMCLLGERELDRQIASARLPSTPAAVATSPVFDPHLHAHVADRVLHHLLSEAAGKSVVTTIGRKTPIIGGGIGGMADLLDTRMVSRCARTHFHMRRPVLMTQYTQDPVEYASYPG